MDINDFKRMAGDRLDRPIYTHDMADQQGFWGPLKEACYAEFVEIVALRHPTSDETER